ncbi:MAG: hypothetical protein K2J77_06140 [Oscillospiraceae bacterium]|nr:hypothetical protein [Oscillospiraceae bacterium]
MKKIFTLLLALTLILTSLTACNSGTPVDGPKTESPSAESTAISLPESAAPPAESTVIESTDNTSDLTPVEKVVGIYGETDIPDIHITSDAEGKAISYEESHQLALEQSLDSMIFETHTFGDYTVRLVGDKVRTDNEYFSGYIYAQNLRAEFEKDGISLENCRSGYNEYVIFMSQFAREYRLIPDKIGTYLDFYELEYPVLAMKYYYKDVPGLTVPQALEFRVLRNGAVDHSLLGTFDKGIGVPLADYNDDNGILKLKLYDEDGSTSMLSAFSADRFRIADSNTLIDDEAGVKYTFDFEECFDPNSPKLGHLYTADRIS